MVTAWFGFGTENDVVAHGPFGGIGVIDAKVHEMSDFQQPVAILLQFPNQLLFPVTGVIFPSHGEIFQIDSYVGPTGGSA